MAAWTCAIPLVVLVSGEHHVHLCPLRLVSSIKVRIRPRVGHCLRLTRLILVGILTITLVVLI